MSEWITVIALVLAGVALIITEILFVPGTTVVGILGIAASVFGVYLSFEYFGQDIGVWFTLGAVLAFAAAVYFSFKSKTWEKFSLKDTNKGKVNEGLTQDLKVGDEGIALSSLKPVGKAEFSDNEYEVRTLGQYVDEKTALKILKIELNNIIVEPIN